MEETRQRSITKALSWRVVASATTVGVVFLVSGEIAVAVSVAGLEVAAKLVIYYVHERTWQRLAWGLKT